MPKNKEETPPEVVPESFEHKIHMTELYAKSYEFKLRTFTIKRKSKLDGLGFTVRSGDGWNRKDGIFISRIQFGSTFDICAVISVGDEVVKIEDQNVKDMDVGTAIRSIYESLNLTITVKIPTPFAKKRAGFRWRKINEPPINRKEDFKVLNMRIPKHERYVYKEEEEVAEEKQESESGEVEEKGEE